MADRPPPIPRQRRIQRIQLEPYDDVVSVRDRLQFVSAGRVLLIFTPNSKNLRRKLDLVLIQREAARRDLRLAIVTADTTIAEHAGELNISAFYTVEQARTQRWKRPRNKVFVDRRDRPRLQHDPYDLMLAASRLKPPLTAAQRVRQRVLRGLIFGIAILTLLFGLYAVVPSARVTITPARDQLNITIPIMADPTIDRAIPESLRIPADVRRFIQDATVTIETTGRRAAENTLAEGTVTFINNSGLATFIPAGTVVQTATAPPVQFETLADAALPARQGATADVNIRALESSAGFQGNVEPGAIERVVGPLADGIAVSNQNATFGAGLRETRFVTPEDQNRLQTLARQQVKQNARDSLRLSLDEQNYFLVSESVMLIEERQLLYSAGVNEPADAVTLTMQAVVEAVVIDLVQARLVAFANLGLYVTPGRELNERSLTFRRGEVQQVFDDGRVSFQMRVEGSTQVAIEPNEIRDRLAGNSVDTARNILERQYLLDPRHPVEIHTWPGFLNRMPLLPVRIHVEIEDKT